MNDNALDFLIVESGGRWFALRTQAVEAAVAPRAVTPLPFVPAWVEGLVNINERILPLLDLRRLLGDTQTAAAMSELVVIDTAGTPCALRVDRVVGKVDVAAAELQSHAAESDAADSSETVPALVCGRFEHDGTSVLVLDDEVIGRSISVRDLPQGQRGLLGRQQAGDGDHQHDTLDCLIFSAAGEMYAVDLQEAVEILDLPPATPVPGAPAATEGLARIRDEVILVLSLARLLRRGDSRADAATVIVIERDGIRYGLRVDRLDGIHSFHRDALRRIDDDSSELVGVLAGDEQLFGLIAPARLISDALHTTLVPLVPRRQQTDIARHEILHPMLQVSLGNEAFAIPLAQVKRIATWTAPEPLRDSEQGLVSGAVTVDGNVMPVVELAGILQSGGDNTGAWIIVGSDNREWAIAVREATQILDIPGSAIEEIGGRADGFVTAVAHVDNRLLSLLSMNPLLRSDATAMLSTADKGSASA